MDEEIFSSCSNGSIWCAVFNVQGKKNPGTNTQFVLSFLIQVKDAKEMNLDRYVVYLFTLELIIWPIRVSKSDELNVYSVNGLPSSMDMWVQACLCTCIKKLCHSKNAPKDVIKAIYGISFDPVIRIICQSDDHSEMHVPLSLLMKML
nr:importin-9 [Ipomoea trifida]